MKKIFLLFLSIIAIQISKAQGPGWIWALSSSGGEYEYANGIAVDTTGHFFIAGRLSGTMTFGTQSATAGGADNPYVGGFDTSSTCNWLKEYTYSGGFDYPWGFCKDKNDNVYSGGVVNSGGSSPMFIEKYNKSGTMMWKVLVTGGGLAADGLAVDGAGCVYAVGSFQSFSSPTFGSTTLTYTGSYQAIFIAKMDSNGNWLWAKMVDGTGADDGYDVARGIGIDQFANIYVTGGYYNMPDFGGGTSVPNQSSNPYPSLYVAELDSSGNTINVTTATNAGFNNGDCCTTSKLTVDSCGYFYVTGYFQGTAQFGNFSISSSGGEADYVAKCSNSGVWQWANSITGSGSDQGQAIALDKTSDVYAGGNYGNGSSTISGSGNWGDSTISGGDVFIAKFANSTGALQWVKSQTTGSGGIGGISVDNKNYMYVTGSYTTSVSFGSTTLNPTGNSNVFVAKLDTVGPLRIIPIIDTSYCAGSTDTIKFKLIGNFNSGNIFTAQLSDSTGSFANDTVIGSDTSSSAGYIVITIPSGTPTGSNYLIRVVSSNPPTSSYANGCGAYYTQNVYPNDFYVSIGNGITLSIIPSLDTICFGGSVQLSASGGGAGATYQWTIKGNATILSTTDTFTVSPATTTTYYVAVGKGTCSGMDSAVVMVNSVLPLTVQPPSSQASTCAGQGITLSVPTSGSDYVWIPAATLNSATGDSVIATPYATTTYTVSGINSTGCAVTGYDTVSIKHGINKPIITDTDNVLASTATQGNQWYRNSAEINGATGIKYDLTDTGCYWDIATNIANGCSSISDTICVSKLAGIKQLAVNSSQISIFPNPTNGEIILNISSSVGEVRDWYLQITDVLGRTVYTKLSLNYNNDIDLSDLSGGVYFVSVINNAGRAVVPVVKQ